MSLTIHNSAKMTAVDLRERRRQRILQNAEKRLSTILKGPDGDEIRQVPCIDGFGLLNEDKGSDVEEKISYDEQNLPLLTSSVLLDIILPSTVSYGFIDRHRFWIMIAFGLFLRLAVMLELINYVFLTFTTIFFQLELFLLFSQNTIFRRYPQQDFLINMLMVTGFNQKLINRYQFILNLMLDFGMDACLMSFSFLCFHLLFITGKYLTEHN
ncbi:hypothetical protein Mgra_00009423 [Meloidogyne graminicola]|uniref:Uncharacterized protein n=1 Tax=Meloidogyne graminicola TaxID=189291 RepID=A0A8S9ZBD4_9BILA|nr:hypothetical protein Mgra_00009423 [Meloidogyne graminicola]